MVVRFHTIWFLVVKFAGNAYWAETLPLFAHRARPDLLDFKKYHLVFALGERNAVHAVVSSIIWGFRRLKYQGAGR